MKRVTEYREETETIVRKIPYTKLVYEVGDMFLGNRPGTRAYGKIFFISEVRDYKYGIQFLPDFSEDDLANGFEEKNLQNTSLLYLGKFTKA